MSGCIAFAKDATIVNLTRRKLLVVSGILAREESSAGIVLVLPTRWMYTNSYVLLVVRRSANKLGQLRSPPITREAVQREKRIKANKRSEWDTQRGSSVAMMLLSSFLQDSFLHLSRRVGHETKTDFSVILSNCLFVKEPAPPKCIERRETSQSPCEPGRREYFQSIVHLS